MSKVPLLMTSQSFSLSYARDKTTISFSVSLPSLLFTIFVLLNQLCSWLRRSLSYSRLLILVTLEYVAGDQYRKQKYLTRFLGWYFKSPWIKFQGNLRSFHTLLIHSKKIHWCKKEVGFYQPKFCQRLPPHVKLYQHPKS